MVKDHSNSVRKPAATKWATLSDYQQWSFYMHHPTNRIRHTTAVVTPVVEHWVEQDLAQWVHHEGSIWQPIAPWANALTMELYLTPGMFNDKYKKRFVHYRQLILINNNNNIKYIFIIDLQQMPKRAKLYFGLYYNG